MKNIVIISTSVREGRLGHRVSLFLKNYLQENSIANCEILDLKEYDFPIFEERLMYQKSPSSKLLGYVDKFNKADGIIIVSSVYNYSYPASLKNVIDVLNSEWKRKIVALTSATMATTEGIPTTFQIENTLSQMGAIVSPVKYFATSISSEFNEDGTPTDKEKMEKRAKPMIDELMWLVEKLKA